MSQLQIGWASRDVSTDQPINIPGQFHMRISKGIMDPVTITALTIDNGTDLVIFLSADLVVIRSGLLDLVREKTARLNPAIPVAKIVMNATHTHTGASHYDNSSGSWRMTGSSTADTGQLPDHGIKIASSDAYRDALSTAMAEIIVEAYANQKPGGVAFGYGYAVVGHSRRVIYTDDTAKRPGSAPSGFKVNGHGVMYGNSADPNFSHYEAGADHFVNLLYTFDADKKLTGAIINVPCPSQNSEQEYYLSADYWHDTRVAIRKQFGDIFILPQCAAAGDLSPRILHYKKAQTRRFKLKYDIEKTEMAARKDIAERIAAAFAEVYSWAAKDIQTDLPLTHTVKTVELSKRLISDDEVAFARQNLQSLESETFAETGTPEERLSHDSRLIAQRNRFVRIIDRYDNQAAEPKLPMELHVLRLGDVAFATNRFELYMDYMHRIQARSPFAQTFVIQLTGVPGPDGGTYLATERGAANKGYSACLFCNLVSPQGGQELVDETVKILTDIYTE